MMDHVLVGMIRDWTICWYISNLTYLMRL